MLTLKEVLDMEYDENRAFKRIELEPGDIFDRLVYTDEDGILRYELSEQDEQEGKMYGDAVLMDSEILESRFRIVNLYIPFIDAFNEWYFNNKTICCVCIDTSILRYDRDEQPGMCKFFPEDIAEGEWYIEEDELKDDDIVDD